MNHEAVLAEVWMNPWSAPPHCLLFHEVILYKLYRQRALAHSTSSHHHQFILSHLRQIGRHGPGPAATSTICEICTSGRHLEHFSQISRGARKTLTFQNYTLRRHVMVDHYRRLMTISN